MDRDGKWFVEHTAADLKTDDTYGKNGHKRVVKLPSEVYPLLEAWLSQWRKVFKPVHNYVFSQPNGNPIPDAAFYNYVCKRVYRLAGQDFTPYTI